MTDDQDFNATSDAAITRRELLQRLSAGTTAVLIGSSFPLAAQSQGAVAPSEAGEAATRVPLKPAIKASLAPFSLTDVRLHDGPFLRAQKLDANYLLELEPDRMLHGFRVHAGLQPKAAIYGGWESEEPWVEIRCHGHTLGHYLSACSFMHASTADQRFKQRVDYIVDELHACQKANESGLICAFPDGSAQLDNSVNGRKVLGVPWYTMHKVFAGLRDAHLYADSALALNVLVRLSDWASSFTQHLTDAQFEQMLGVEHGGMNEILADVYALTGEPKYLTLARKFSHRALLNPLVEKRDTLDGLHSNTQIPKVIGFHRIHELTGEAQQRAAAEFFWNVVVGRRSFVTGGNGDIEHFFAPSEFAARLGSAKTMETCCVHNLLRLTRALFQHDPSVTYADYYERALYNSILASQDPDSGMVTYFQPTRPGYLKLYCTPTRSFWCCTGTGMENHAKYGDSLYFQAEDALYINLFVPSAVTWRQKGVTLTQATRFPESETTRLTLAVARPTSFALKVRHPGWCEEVSVSINGRRHKVSRAPGRYIELYRKWRDGDVVELQLPMNLRTEELPGNPTIVAVMYGPIVLAGRLGREGIAPGADIITNERTYGQVLDVKVPVPAWVGQPQHFTGSIVASRSSPLTFHASGFEGGRNVELVPYYRIAHERYNLYWTVRAPV